MPFQFLSVGVRQVPGPAAKDVRDRGDGSTHQEDCDWVDLTDSASRHAGQCGAGAQPCLFGQLMRSSRSQYLRRRQSAAKSPDIAGQSQWRSSATTPETRWTLSCTPRETAGEVTVLPEGAGQR